MHLDTVLCKTDLVRELLLSRELIPRQQRLFIIMVDGRKTLAQLGEAARQLGICGTSLAQMVKAGWLHPQAPARRRPARAQEPVSPPLLPATPAQWSASVADVVDLPELAPVAGVAATAAVTPLRPQAQDSAPAAPSPATPAPQRSYSLAAAKLYAMDLLALMAPGADRELRQAAAEASDADRLRVWLDRAVAAVALRAGPERARLFLDKVAQMLPPGFMDQDVGAAMAGG